MKLPDKNTFRKQAAAKRNALSPALRREKDFLIRERLLSSEAYRKASSIGFYYSFRSEADTTGLILQALSDGKRVYLPKTCYKEEMPTLDFYRIQSLSEVREGFWGIPEPDPSVCEMLPPDEAPALLIVPGLAFDLKKNRMGYGKGFYDRYIADHNTVTAGIAYQEQIYEEIPTGKYDRRLHMIVTDVSVIE
ncbi:MAG: 5-formyltetrahydrofolate cyclo-ligase [Lachnospiraceae bacterium]|nr:5-formyltetrahydrofolate cyclo-ligase [Lachnospiraceae bacterium]